MQHEVLLSFQNLQILSYGHCFVCSQELGVKWLSCSCGVLVPVLSGAQLLNCF